MSIRDRLSNSDGDVTCIGCGATVPRSEAREYDKYGDRWNREGKQFEYLCKPCHRDCCQQPRDELESVLVDAGAGEVDTDTFFRRYFAVVTDEAAE